MPRGKGAFPTKSRERGGESDEQKKTKTGGDSPRAGCHGDAGSNLGDFGLSTARRVLVQSGTWGHVVWDLPEEQVDILGKQVGALPFVSHCYLRPRYLPRWPFNLFAMVHGPDRESVAQKVKILKRLLGAAQQEHALLHSSRILKKTGLRLRKRGMNSQEGTA